MEINGQLQMENIKALPEDIMNHSPRHKKNINVMTYGSALILLGLLLWLQTPLQGIKIILSLFIIVIYIIVVPRFLRRKMLKIMKKNLTQSNVQKFLKPYTVYLTEEGIEIVREETVKNIRWHEIDAVTNDEHHYFLYVSDESNIIIPKKDIPSQSEFKAILDASIH